MRPLQYKRGEIYMADLPAGTGCEQGEPRPMLIIQNNTGNRFNPTVIAAAITSRKKRYLPTHIPLEGCGLEKQSLLMAEQIRTLDKSRLRQKIGKLDIQTMAHVNQGLKISLGLVNKGTSVICLCTECANLFYKSRCFFIKRIDRHARKRSRCRFCRKGYGFEYAVTFK